MNPPTTLEGNPNPSTTGTYTISWSIVPTATSYVLEEYVGTCWVPFALTGTSRAYSNRATGSYSYRVKACNASGCSTTYSPTLVEVVNSANPPFIPQNLTATPAYSLDGSYVVRWDAVNGPNITYRLEESTAPNAWNEVANQATTSKAFSGRADRDYPYRVKACNPACSAPSPNAFAYVRRTPPPPR